VPERADDHIAARELRHAATRELERVVLRLVGQDFDREHDTLLAGDIGRDPQLVRQPAGLRDRSDLVDDDGLHHCL